MATRRGMNSRNSLCLLVVMRLMQTFILDFIAVKSCSFWTWVPVFGDFYMISEGLVVSVKYFTRQSRYLYKWYTAFWMIRKHNYVGFFSISHCLVFDQLCDGAGWDEAAGSGCSILLHDPCEPLPASLRGGWPLEWGALSRVQDKKWHSDICSKISVKGNLMKGIH